MEKKIYRVEGLEALEVIRYFSIGYKSLETTCGKKHKNLKKNFW